jgi:hypothetical protein
LKVPDQALFGACVEVLVLCLLLPLDPMLCQGCSAVTQREFAFEQHFDTSVLSATHNGDQMTVNQLLTLATPTV